MKKFWKDARCIKQYVPIVEMNVKYHSNPMVKDQYTAESVMLKEDLEGQATVEEDHMDQIDHHTEENN